MRPHAPRCEAFPWLSVLNAPCGGSEEGLAMSKSVPPGTPAPSSGQYRPGGGGSEITGVKGRPLPPTPKSGQGWVLVDRTRHKR